MNIASLSEKPELRLKTISLIERSFEYSRDHSFEIDFYPLMAKSNDDNIYIIYDESNDEVLAHLASKRRTLKGNKSKINLLLLGGICVKENHRGQGLFKSLLEHAQKNNPDCALSMLWSGEPEIYQSFGFHLCIDQYEYTKNDITTPLGFSESRLKELSAEQLKQIAKLYNDKILNKFLAPERNEKTWAELAEIKTAKLFYTSIGETILDYFIMDKGEDLRGIIHESSIHPEDYGFHSILSYGNCWSPQLSGQITPVSQYASLVRINNTQQLSTFLQQENDITIQISKSSKDTISITYSSETFELHDRDFLLACFGPTHNPILPEMKKIYVPGLDSV